MSKTRLLSKEEKQDDVLEIDIELGGIPARLNPNPEGHPDVAYTRLADAPPEEIKQPAPPCEITSEFVTIQINEKPPVSHSSKDEKKSQAEEKLLPADIDLDAAVKASLGDLNNIKYRGLCTQTRTDIMNALQYEMSTLQDIPIDDLVNALRYMILKNPELRQQAEVGRGRDIFTVRTEDYDNFFSGLGGGFVRGAGAVMDPCSNPFFCLVGGEVAAECCILMSLLAMLGCACWATGRPATMTCQSRESSTIKTLKLLAPVAISITVAALMYRVFGDDFEAWSTRNQLDTRIGSVGGPLLAGWAAYLLSSSGFAAVECAEQKNEGSNVALARYLIEHPIRTEVQKAVFDDSNIEKLLVKYKREGDSNPQVREFSRDVLNHWIDKLESVQKQKRDEKMEKEEKQALKV